MGLASFNRSRKIHGQPAGPLPADAPGALLESKVQAEPPKPSPPILARDRVHGGHVQVDPLLADGSRPSRRSALFAEAKRLGIKTGATLTDDELLEVVRRGR
jgi:hypothetical protein